MVSPPPSESSFDAHQARFAEYWTKRPADELAHALVDSEDEVARLRTMLAALAEDLRGRVAVLEKALRDVRDLAGDRERFVMLGPRAFVAAVRIVDAVLGSADPKKTPVQP